MSFNFEAFEIVPDTWKSQLSDQNSFRSPTVQLTEMVGAKVFNLVQVTLVVLVLVAAVEYFKYSTKANYEWIHCTAQTSLVPNTNITRATAFGGTSCDKRGQMKAIVNKLTRTFDPNEEKLAFCLQEEQDIVAGYIANVEEEQTLKGLCDHIIHLDDSA